MHPADGQDPEAPHGPCPPFEMVVVALDPLLDQLARGVLDLRQHPLECRRIVGRLVLPEVERDGPAIYNIVDDEPAPAGVWLPELAKIVGARPPQRFPRLLARLFAGEAPVVMATESRGASNAKAKRELGWTLRYPS